MNGTCEHRRQGISPKYILIYTDVVLLYQVDTIFYKKQSRYKYGSRRYYVFSRQGISLEGRSSKILYEYHARGHTRGATFEY